MSETRSLSLEEKKDADGVEEGPAKKIKTSHIQTSSSSNATVANLVPVASLPIAPTLTPLVINDDDAERESAGLFSSRLESAKRKREDSALLLQISPTLAPAPSPAEGLAISPKLSPALTPSRFTRPSWTPRSLRIATPSPTPPALRISPLTLPGIAEEGASVSPKSVQMTLFPLPRFTKSLAKETKVIAPKIVLDEKTQSYFNRLGQLAEMIGGLPLTSQENIFALSYGIILIGEIAIELLRKPKPLIQAKGEMHGFRGGRFSLGLISILENLIQVRNIVADHFIRITDHASLLNLGNDISKLAVFKSKDEQVENGILNNLSALAKLESRIGSKAVNNMHRFAYIISLLKEINQIKQAKVEEEALKLFPLCMRYVIAGTAARELQQQSLIPAEMKEAGDLLAKLDALRELRNTFAHLSVVYKDKAYYKAQIMSLNDKEYITALSSKVEFMQSVLQKTYAASSLSIRVADEEASDKDESSMVQSDSPRFAFRPISSVCAC